MLNLGVNLILGRRIYKGGLKGIFNLDKMYYKQGNMKVIEATMNQGLYIVSHIAKGYQETAFYSDSDDKLDSDDLELKLNDKQRYLLWYRRFVHLGPNKIRHLYKVTTLERLIHILSKRDICEVYTLTKIKNSIPKELSV